MYREKILENGAEIITCRMPAMNSVSAGVWLCAGSRYENEENNGISHFMEHMVFKGSAKRSGKEIRRQIEGTGGSLNGFTSQEGTCYLFKVAGEKFHAGMDILLDMVLNPLLKQSDIKKERGVIREEIGRIADLPTEHVHVLFDRLVWGKHPLGLNVCGTAGTINQINSGSLAGYKGAFHGPGNMIISCAGNIEHEMAAGVIGELLPPGASCRRRVPPPVKGRQFRKRVVVRRRKTEQSHLCMGYRTFPYNHGDRYVLSVLSAILGGGMSSRLFEEIREKRGLAYNVGSSVHWLSDTGNFIVSAGTAPARAAEAVRVIISEINKLRGKAVFRKELVRAKEFLTGQFLLAMEGTSNVMLWMGENKVLSGAVPDVQDVLDGIRRVAAEDIRRVACSVFREEGLNLALIGPNKAGEIENAV